MTRNQVTASPSQQLTSTMETPSTHAPSNQETTATITAVYISSSQIIGISSSCNVLLLCLLMYLSMFYIVAKI